MEEQQNQILGMSVPAGKNAGLRASIAAAHWPSVAGFALAQTWTVLCIALPDPVTYGEPFLDLRWLSLLSAALLSTAVAMCGPLGAAVSHDRRAFVAIGAVSALSSMLGPVSAAFSEPVSSAMIHVAAFGVGSGFALMYACWFARICARRDMTGLALSLVASMLLTYPLANVLSSDQISPWASALVGSLLPLASVACDLGAPLPADRRSKTPPQAAFSRLSSSDRSLCLRFLICVCLVVAVFETLRNLLLGGTAIGFYAGIANLGGVAVKAVCAIWLVNVFWRRDPRGVSLAYRAAFLLLLGIVLCLPLLLSGSWAAHMLLDVGSFFFQATVLMAAFQTNRVLGIGAVQTFGAARAAWALGTLGGIAISGGIGGAGDAPLQALSIALGMCAAVAMLLVFTDRDCVEILAPTSGRRTDRGLLERVEAFSAELGLSEREREVVAPLVTGRSAPRIAQTMGITLATVNTHIHHIYTKAGVHSRQELMDMIEGDGWRIG